MTVKMRLTERPNWTKLGSITKKFGTADKIALKAIQGEISSHEDDMGPDLFGQLDARFQQYQSARQLQEFPNLVKLVGLTSKGFFLGIMESDLHAWQMQFSQKQLNFLKYAAGASGVSQAGVAILPPTPFSFEMDVEIDEGAIASNFYKGLGFGAAGKRSSKFTRMARKAGKALSSLGGMLSRGGKRAGKSISRAGRQASKAFSRGQRNLSRSFTRNAKSFSRGAKRTGKKIFKSIKRAFR